MATRLSGENHEPIVTARRLRTGVHMLIRSTALTLGVALLFGCAVKTSDLQTANTAGSDSDSDSDDYSSWFDGITQADTDELDVQFDADQASYPTEISEPDHDPNPTTTARRGSGFGGVGARAEATRWIGAGTGSDEVDAGTGSGSGSGSDAGSGSGSGDTCGSGNGPVTLTGSATLDVQFAVAVADQYIGTFGPVRDHNIWARGSASGTARLTLSGTITGTADSWSATISVNGNANTTVWIHADQELVGRFRRGWFAIGDATLSGTATFSDSVTATLNCNGVRITTPGTPAVGVNVTVDDFRFYGYFFPRLQGPIVTRVRGAIAQFARNFANRQLPGLIGPRVFQFNQAYAAKKAELLNALIARLPAGCGCASSTGN
jgi:hypothetical protein